MSFVGRLRSKNLHTWLPGYGRYLAHRAVEEIQTQVRIRTGADRADGPRHLLFAMCDHYEPLWGKASIEQGNQRVQTWEQGYPTLADPFRDADGKKPQHSFFFPGEEYTPQFLDALARLARAGYGEVEFHLHHDGDTAETLREVIVGHLARIAQHGHFSRDSDGRVRYAFIHGNWCLANARKDGRWCGVNEEIPLLWETGCYVDMTFPSAPDESQPNIVNQVYWPTGNLARRRGYEHGTRARVGSRMSDRILLIQGPIALARRPGKMAVRIESSAIDDSDPPSPARLRTWVNQQIHVEGRPEWVFVKLHTHGAPEPNAAVLLGEHGRLLHQTLTTRYNDGQRWILHYVTAREMYNIAMAAIDGRSGDPNQYRDYERPPPPVLD
ncbi:MAG: hypothetical protein MJE77_21435 [Proteobacteria bacterium]|nr:hypothetical protein [Pseudomonadota bacterium]